MTMVLTPEIVEYVKNYGKGKGSWGCSEEHRQSLSKANRGKVHSEEWNQNVSRAKLAKSKPVDWTPEMIAAFPHVGEGSGAPGKSKSEEHCRHMSEARFGSTMSEEANRRNSEAQMGKVYGEERNRKVSIGMQKYWAGLSSEEKEARIRGSLVSEEAIIRSKVGVKEYWGRLSPEERQTRYRSSFGSDESISKRLKSLRESPTMPETLLGSYLQDRFPGVWAYNGDYSQRTRIGDRVPDFINMTGEKVVIEMLGGLGFAHFIEDERKVVEHYAKYGFVCIVVWDWDLWAPGELSRIFGERVKI